MKARADRSRLPTTRFGGAGALGVARAVAVQLSSGCAVEIPWKEERELRPDEVMEVMMGEKHKHGEKKRCGGGWR